MICQIVMNPTLKYLLTTNIWLWDLEVKWCNQWTSPYPKILRSEVKGWSSRVMCRSTCSMRDRRLSVLKERGR